jgi:hypothetical protein
MDLVGQLERGFESLALDYSGAQPDTSISAQREAEVSEAAHALAVAEEAEQVEQVAAASASGGGGHSGKAEAGSKAGTKGGGSKGGGSGAAGSGGGSLLSGLLPTRRSKRTRGVAVGGGEEGSGGVPWNCPHCTFLNTNPAATVCEVCQNVRSARG